MNSQCLEKFIEAQNSNLAIANKVKNSHFSFFFFFFPHPPPPFVFVCFFIPLQTQADLWWETLCSPNKLPFGGFVPHDSIDTFLLLEEFVEIETVIIIMIFQIQFFLNFRCSVGKMDKSINLKTFFFRKLMWCQQESKLLEDWQDLFCCRWHMQSQISWTETNCELIWCCAHVLAVYRRKELLKTACIFVLS